MKIFKIFLMSLMITSCSTQRDLISDSSESREFEEFKIENFEPLEENKKLDIVDIGIPDTLLVDKHNTDYLKSEDESIKLVTRLQIGSFGGQPNNEFIQKISEFDFFSILGNDGLTRYYIGDFESVSEANEFRKKLIDKFPDAFLVYLEEISKIDLESEDNLYRIKFETNYIELPNDYLGFVGEYISEVSIFYGNFSSIGEAIEEKNKIGFDNLMIYKFANGRYIPVLIK